MRNTTTFTPLSGFANRHSQTLAAAAFGRIHPFTFIRQQLTLPDGDFVDLDWTRLPEAQSDTPIVIIFHGLEGSSHSHYARTLAQAVHHEGWCAVVMNFRSCSGRLNLKARLYHSGETGDADFLADWLKKQYPSAPLYATGFSLGGNMLLKMAGEQGDDLKFDAILSVCAPIKLDESTLYMIKGLSRFYQAYLLRALKNKVLSKFNDHDYEALIQVDKKDITGCKDIRDFDNIFTARIHGFDSASDYYAKNSAYPYIESISKQCLIIHAADDPIAPPSILPKVSTLPGHIKIELSASGGHVGFLGGRLVKPVFWLPGRILSYFSQQRL